MCCIAGALRPFFGDGEWARLPAETRRVVLDTEIKRVVRDVQHRAGEPELGEDRGTEVVDHGADAVERGAELRPHAGDLGAEGLADLARDPLAHALTMVNRLAPEPGGGGRCGAVRDPETPDGGRRPGPLPSVDRWLLLAPVAQLDRAADF